MGAGFQEDEHLRTQQFDLSEQKKVNGNSSIATISQSHPQKKLPKYDFGPVEIHSIIKCVASGQI